jgi:hypothetical protein
MERSDTVDLMKIDVEGSEMKVLKGAHETISVFRPSIMVEVHPSMLEEMGHSVRDLFQFLEDLDYSLWHLLDCEDLLFVPSSKR